MGYVQLLLLHRCGCTRGRISSDEGSVLLNAGLEGPVFTYAQEAIEEAILLVFCVNVEG